MLLPLFLSLAPSPCTLFVGFSIGLISLLSVVCSLPAAAKIVQHFLKPGACECSTACHWCCVCVCVRVLAKLLSCSAAQLLSLLVSLGLALGSHMRFVWSSTQREARQGTARQGLRRKPNSIAFSAFSRVLFSLLFSFSFGSASVG